MPAWRAIAKTDRAVGRLQVRRGAREAGDRLRARGSPGATLSNTWQIVPLRRQRSTSSEMHAQGEQPRSLIADAAGPCGSLAVFPPPHTFFWARELATNLGYVLVPQGRRRHHSRSACARPKREETPQYRRQLRARTARAPGTLAAACRSYLLRVRRHREQATLGSRRWPFDAIGDRYRAARRLPGDEPSLPHGSRPAAARGRQPRRRDSPISRRSSRSASRSSRRSIRSSKADRRAQRGPNPLRGDDGIA